MTDSARAASDGTSRPLTGVTLLALLMGFAGGFAAHEVRPTLGAQIANVIEPLGQLWGDSLRILAYPLLVCILIDAIAGRIRTAPGRMGLLSLVCFLAFLLAGAILTLALTPISFALLDVPQGSMGQAIAVAHPRSEAPEHSWLTGIFGDRFDRALLNGNLLAIVLVALASALAMSRLPAPARRAILDPVHAALQLLLVLLGWLLLAAPVGVFSLTFSLSSRNGLDAMGSLGAFVVIVIAMLLILTLLCYPAALFLGRVSISRFAHAAAPAQAVAMGTRSSIASLPALLDSGRRLGLPEQVNGLVLPLSVAVFKANRTISGLLKYLFLVHVYGIDASSADILAYAGLVLVISFASPGTPSGGAHSSTAILVAAGVPIEGVLLLIAIDAIPDIAKTLLNVTADLTVACVVARFSPPDTADSAP
ncbi:MAG: cation:dicarboxylase symporter family transporter [Phycisphaeraceae bacterium]|nr:cation:dicarboxylase symporter family transporter [Phycisphaeraceae bacterium]